MFPKRDQVTSSFGGKVLKFESLRGSLEMKESKCALLEVGKQVQRGSMTCPKSHGYQKVDLASDPRALSRGSPSLERVLPVCTWWFFLHHPALT